MTARKYNRGTALHMMLGLPVEDSSLVPAEDMDVCDGFQHNILSSSRGFYKGGWLVLDQFLPILATLKVSLQTQISSATILFIHLTLVDNNTTGGLFNLTYKFLKPYFLCHGITYQEVTFDITTVSKTTSYQEQHPWLQVIISITDHMDSETGDPFASSSQSSLSPGKS
ncbi:hypothetical protein BDR05DRAFT_950680 [Suillus weaverae]|nr:hypothetical protein BDR05DRAFT_950680 [Suillus weaverae]